MLRVQMPLICINRWTLFAGQSALSNNHYEYELLRIKKLCFAPYRSWRSFSSKEKKKKKIEGVIRRWRISSAICN